MYRKPKPGARPEAQDTMDTLAEAREPLRVGLVGYGLGGATFHAPLITETPGLELTAIATSDPERVRKATARYPNATIVARPDAFWSMTPPLDLVVVSTPHATHAPIASAALAAGSHVVVDKPFAITSAEARDLAAEAKRHGKLAIPFQNRRWDNEILTLQKLMREGTLGDIHRYESRYERWRPVPKARWTEPGAGDRGEGVLGDLTVHLVDQALMLFGSARSVYAEFERRHPQVARDRRRVRRDPPQERRALAPLHEPERRHPRPAHDGARQQGRIREARHRPTGGGAPCWWDTWLRWLGGGARVELGQARRRRRGARRAHRAWQLPRSSTRA